MASVRKRRSIFTCNLDVELIDKLAEMSRETGKSMSEIVRESLRKTIQEWEKEARK